MVGVHEPQPELNGLLGLLGQLARYFEANETKFSSRDCKSSLGCLSEVEIFSLQRLTVLLCLNRCTGSEVVPVPESVVSQDNCGLSSTVYLNSKDATVSVSLDRFTPDSTDETESNFVNETSQNSPIEEFVDTATSAEEHTAESHIREQSLLNEASASVTASREAVLNATQPGFHQGGNIPAKFSCREFFLEEGKSPPGKSTCNAPREITPLSVRCTNTREPSPSTLHETTGSSSGGAFLEPTLLDERPESPNNVTSEDSHPTPSSIAEQSTPASLEEVISSPATDVSQEPQSHKASNQSDEAEMVQSLRATVCSSGEVQAGYDETGSDEPEDNAPEDNEPEDDESEDDEPEDDEPEDDEPEDDEPEDNEPEENEPQDSEPDDDESHHTVSEILRGTSFETCSIALSHQLERILKKCSADHSHFLRNVDESCLPSGGGFSNAFYQMHKRKEKRDLCKIYQRFECLNLYRLAVGLGYHTGAEWKWSAVDDLAEEIQIQYPHESFEKEKVKTRLKKHVHMGRRYNIWAEHFGNFGYLIALPLQITPTEYTGKAFSLSRFVPAAVQRLKDLGIDKLVEELDLAPLGKAVTNELSLRSEGGRLRNRGKTKKRRKEAYTEESRMPKSRRLLDYRPTECAALRTSFPLPASSLRSTDHDYQPAPTPVPCLVPAPDFTRSIAPSILRDHQGVSDPSNFCHPTPVEPMLSEHNLESTGQLALPANINDPSKVSRGDFASPATVDPVYGRLDQHFFSSQEPAGTGHLIGHTPCARWDIDMYPSWTYCHSEAAMKQFLAELDAEIRRDTLFY